MISRLIYYALAVLQLLMFKVCVNIRISKIEFFDFSCTKRVNINNVNILYSLRVATYREKEFQNLQDLKKIGKGLLKFEIWGLFKKVMKSTTHLGIIKFFSLQTIYLATYCECRLVASCLLIWKVLKRESYIIYELIKCGVLKYIVIYSYEWLLLESL